MEWQAPAIVLDARPYGEGGAVAVVLTEAQGRHGGMVHGGASRGQAAVWQAGNLIEARWRARLADQLGSLGGELVHPTAALALEDPLALALLSAACAVAGEALPEREAHPRLFRGLLPILARLGTQEATATPGLLPDYIRWELLLLTDLGYGLDLSRCAQTGATEGLTHVSPRTGRAVCAEVAEPYRDRLLPLPAFLRDEQAASGPEDWAAGLRLTGHFLARDAFGTRHRPVPAAREMLYDRVSALAAPPEPLPEVPPDDVSA
ncbi:DNA repair protein RecO [Roseomonas mucosa]|uniref:DNA repair protein RecO n=1 Tax=Roseomonas mucosa TaxID=207340 RepID=UPI0022400871